MPAKKSKKEEPSKQSTNYKSNTMSSELTTNAVQEKEIEFMNKRLDRFEDLIEKGFDKIHTLIEKLQTEHVKESEWERELSRIKEEMATKVSSKDFEPIKVTLYRINWLIISAIIIALLGLILVKTI